MLENVVTIANALVEGYDWSDYHERRSRSRQREVRKGFGAEYLGAGLTRAAFRVGDYVIKLGVPSYNRTEWDVWQRVSPSPFKEVLCAVYHITPCGQAIVQEYGGEPLEAWEKANGYSRDVEVETALERMDNLLERALKGTPYRAVDLHDGNITATGRVFDFGHFC